MQNQEKPISPATPPEHTASPDQQAKNNPLFDTLGADDNPESLDTAEPISLHEEQLAAAEAKAKDLQDAFLRAKAESENMRRRAQEDIAKAHKFAIEGFAEAMLPVKDSLEMAIKVETPSVESYKEGVEATLRQLASAFEKTAYLKSIPNRATSSTR